MTEFRAERLLEAAERFAALKKSSAMALDQAQERVKLVREAGNAELDHFLKDIEGEGLCDDHVIALAELIATRDAADEAIAQHVAAAAALPPQGDRP